MMSAEQIAERRQTERFPLMLQASIGYDDGFMDVTIFDISAGGAKIRLDGDEIPAETVLKNNFILNVPAYGKFSGDIAWKDDEYIGVQFHRDHSEELTPLVS